VNVDVDVDVDADVFFLFFMFLEERTRMYGWREFYFLPTGLRSYVSCSSFDRCDVRED